MNYAINLLLAVCATLVVVGVVDYYFQRRIEARYHKDLQDEWDKNHE